MRSPTSRSPAPYTAALCLAGLAGCTSFSSTDNLLGIITPYRIEVVQGNVVTREQMALVKPGLMRSQVRDILGSPLLADVFHGQRWDYVFTIRRPGTEPQRRSIVVLFDGDLVQSVDAPELPSELEFIAAISRRKLPDEPRKLELNEEERKALPAPPPLPAPAVALPQGAARDYPPLETL